MIGLNSQDGPAPNFFVLGAQKAGTTWLARVLSKQDRIFIPQVKETHYFTRYFDRGPQWYLRHFSSPAAHMARWVGEATPNYLAITYPEYQETARRIRAFREDARFLVVLRNPVNRALSAYLHHVCRGRFDPRSGPEEHFRRILADEMPSCGILEFGLYGQALEGYLRHFRPAQFKIFIYEQSIVRDPLATITDTLAFLGFADRARVGNLDMHPNRSIRTRVAARTTCCLSSWMRTDEVRFKYGGAISALGRALDALPGARRLVLDPAVRRRLADYYREDVRMLRGILGRRDAIWSELE